MRRSHRLPPLPFRQVGLAARTAVSLSLVPVRVALGPRVTAAACRTVGDVALTLLRDDTVLFARGLRAGSSPSHDVAEARATDALTLLGKSSIRGIEGMPVYAMRGSAKSSGVPAFAPAVLHVVGACSEKEVIGADAARVVAVMADVHAIGNCAIVDLPRCAVRERKALLPVRATLHEDATIPPLVARGTPLPASDTALRNLGPEASCKSVYHSLNIQRVSCAVYGELQP